MKTCKKKGCNKKISYKYTYCFDHRKLHESKKQRKFIATEYKYETGRKFGNKATAGDTGTKRHLPKSKKNWNMTSYGKHSE